MGWLYRSMSEAKAIEVMGCTTARALWSALENLYDAHTRAKMVDLQTMLQTTRKGTTPMEKYLRLKRSWSDQLALAGDPYPEPHLVSNVLSGLDVEYITIVSLIKAMNNLTHVTWQELQETLLNFDAKLGRFSNLQPGSMALNPQSSTPPSANFANKQNPRNNNNNNNGGRGYHPNRSVSSEALKLQIYIRRRGGGRVRASGVVGAGSTTTTTRSSSKSSSSSSPGIEKSQTFLLHALLSMSTLFLGVALF
ncbi:hypothetical protein F8388_016162 [Cannabis sativa]|uniref:Uncharacterized protein n=1 Tax=Cannabis sativa TaxID=3483 RepID=A0A7J6FIG5_CANSA|nr:hypothetical protein F8388_016162 [Cannabis sativa]